MYMPHNGYLPASFEHIPPPHPNWLFRGKNIRFSIQIYKIAATLNSNCSNMQAQIAFFSSRGAKFLSI